MMMQQFKNMENPAMSNQVQVNPNITRPGPIPIKANHILSADEDDNSNSGGGPAGGLRVGPGMGQRNNQLTMIGGNIPVKK
jgi:hypothetical protein